MLIQIQNDGADIVATNYWDTDLAAHGFCYLTANAGVLRLLLPSAAVHLLPEMKTGRTVTIEQSITSSGNLDIVFEDGTDSPFALTIDRKQIDRFLTPGACQLTVWTQAGRVLTLQCNILHH